MKLNSRAYLVGGGNFGANLSQDMDCNVYVVDGGNGELALVDVGMGIGSSKDEIMANIRGDGLEPKNIKHIFLTHAHADHAGAIGQFKRELPDAKIYAPWESARFLREADAEAIGLNIAKAGGFFPADYEMEACPVDIDVQDGQELKVGDCTFQMIDTPGHCIGHACYTMKADGKTYLFTGDALFYGGRIVIQNIPDCLVHEQGNSVFKMADLGVDVFLPGHLIFSMKNGQRHIDAAAEIFRGLAVPPNLI